MGAWVCFPTIVGSPTVTVLEEVHFALTPDYSYTKTVGAVRCVCTPNVKTCVVIGSTSDVVVKVSEGTTK